jgi:hypothetical protein
MTNELLRDERTALELLPWYVNETLKGEERELVSRQVLASITCRKELERLRRLQQLIQREDAEATATGRAFESGIHLDRTRGRGLRDRGSFGAALVAS